MRYRPFGATGAAVSSLTLSLGAEATARGPNHVRDLVFAGLEAGVNAYHLERLAEIEARLAEQETLLRRTLTMLIEWIERNDNPRAAA